jgi:hypothetical protein
MKLIRGRAAASARAGAVVVPILTMAAAAAHAQAEAPAASVPGKVAFGVAQAITHEGNVYRAPPGASQDDWLSTTALELRADQPLGSGRWRGEMSLRAHRYAVQHELDSNDHRAALVLDFRAMPQLSGTVGAHTHRQRHRDGMDAATFHFAYPIETEHAAHVLTQWGGPEDWVLLAGADAVERSYDQAGTPSSDNLRQHSVRGGPGIGNRPARCACARRPFATPRACPARRIRLMPTPASSARATCGATGCAGPRNGQPLPRRTCWPRPGCPRGS